MMTIYLPDSNDITFASKFESNAMAETWHLLPTSTNINLLSSYAINSRSLTGLRVLDLCCGTGKGIGEILKNVHVREAVFIDRARPVLEMARESVKNIVYSRNISTQFISMPAEFINPLELGKFDAIVIRYSLHLLTDPASVLMKLYQMLNPGGHIVFNFAGGNIYQFLNAKLNAIPDQSGNAHPFFKAVYWATFQHKQQILDNLPHEREGSLIESLNFLYGYDYNIETVGINRLDYHTVMRIIEQAQIPRTSVKYRNARIISPFNHKMAYAKSFGAPPLPGIWNLFNAMEKDARDGLVNRIMTVAQKQFNGDVTFWFPEPVFVVTKQ